MKVKVIKKLKIIMAYIIIFSLIFSLSGLNQEMNVKAEQEETACELPADEETDSIDMADEIVQGMVPSGMEMEIPVDSGSAEIPANAARSVSTPESESTSESGSTSESVSTSESESTSEPVSTSESEGTSEFESKPESESTAESESTSDSGSTSESVSTSGTESTSESESTSDSEPSAQIEQEYTIGKLKALKQNAAANVKLSVPIYRDYDQSLMGYYSFSGGNIENIEDKVFLDLPYQFARAEVEIGQGTDSISYHINYFDEINGIEYYGLANESDELVPDYQIAYELPDDAVVKFIFSLRTNEHRINVVNSLSGFQVEFLYGAEADTDGAFKARFNNPVKVKLSYPTGYCVTAENGKTPVGISFSVPDINVTSVSNLEERTIIYDFICPDKDLTLTVTGDEDTEPLTYGLYDNTSVFGRLEEGENYMKAVNEDGTYVDGSAWYGCRSYGVNPGVLGGTSKIALIANVGSSSVPSERNTATGTFTRGQELYFEYFMDRFERARVNYIYWPSPVLTFNYYPSGMDYSSSMPLSKSIVMWNPGWNAGTEIPEYDLGDGVSIKLEIKQSDMTVSDTNGKPVRYQYKVGITVRNAKNSFYLRAGSASSIQGPHFIRDTTGISSALYDNKSKYDSYILYDPADKHGATQSQLNLEKGTGFLDKQAIGNEYFGEGHGVPPSISNSGIAFKFAVTPRRGYIYPVINSYDDSGSSPVSTIKPVELQAASINELTMGNYSWFHENYEGREEISPFQYVSFMPVEAYDAVHNLQAVDIHAEKITGTIKGVDEDNPIVSKGKDFDLLDNDKIVLNQDYVPVNIPGKTFVGFYATISPAPGNNPLVPDYSRKLYKNQEGTEYFEPGDVVSVSKYFYQNAELIRDLWAKNGTLSEDDRKHLQMLMFTSKYEVNIVADYKDGENVEGGLVTGYINKYLQDITASGLEYLENPSDTKSMRALSGSNLVITNFAPEFIYPADGYTYYLNKDRTTSVNRVDVDLSELASVKYDRGLMVSYKDAEGHDFEGITDTNIYRTYSGQNTADIRFPTAAQSPVGKAFDYWKVEERVSADEWLMKSDMEIRPGAGNKAQYVFASGHDTNNKSIRLTAVWKNILPSDYITIPKKVILLDNGTNLSPAGDYAGAKVTIGYRSVNGNNTSLVVDVKRSFELFLSADETKKIEVKAYSQSGQILGPDGVNPDYARVGLFDSNTAEKTIYFNTESRYGPAYYKGNFMVDSEDGTEPGNSTLFYIYRAK